MQVIIMQKHHTDSLQFKLKMLRLEAGKSQEEFADELGISRSALANYETGKRQPDETMLQKIAVLCHIDPLFFQTRKKKPLILQEESPEESKHLKQLLQHRDAQLDISHFPLGAKLSLVEYYDFMLSIHGKVDEAD